MVKIVKDSKEFIDYMAKAKRGEVIVWDESNDINKRLAMEELGERFEKLRKYKIGEQNGN